MKLVSDKKVYQCEFCNKISLSKSAMQRHELACKKNPYNIRDCIGCKYLTCRGSKVINHYGQEQYNSSANLCYCMKIKKYVYPPKSERNKTFYLQEDIEDGNTECTPMPKHCEHKVQE